MMQVFRQRAEANKAEAGDGSGTTRSGRRLRCRVPQPRRRPRVREELVARIDPLAS